MSDLISRDDAIKDAESWVGMNWYEQHLIRNVIEWLKEFPPAQLGTDCISRQAAIDGLAEYGNGRAVYISVKEAVRRIEQLPPAPPEIVRCKDCKHWIPYDWMFSEMWQSKNMADYPEDEIGCDCSDMAMKADDFCSRAVKREVTT